MEHSASRRINRRTALGLLLTTVVGGTLTACSRRDESRTADGATIRHAFGETTVPSDPTRVVTIGWGAADAALALGVIPVGVDKQPYGSTDGFMPWVREELGRRGADLPTLLEIDGDSPTIEAVAALAPDLILAPYSGISEDSYGKLSKIAPTVAYPKEPWRTPWRDVIGIVGRSVGREDAAKTLAGDLDGLLADVAAKNPGFADRRIAAVAPYNGNLAVFRASDPRVGFLGDLGFRIAPDVADAKGDEFFYPLSLERLAEIDADDLLVYTGAEEGSGRELARSAVVTSAWSRKKGRVLVVDGETLTASVSPPTALSLRWGISRFVDILR